MKVVTGNTLSDTLSTESSARRSKMTQSARGASARSKAEDMCDGVDDDKEVQIKKSIRQTTYNREIRELPKFNSKSNTGQQTQQI